MSDPFYPGVQSNLVYGIATTVEETRMVDGECVVTTQHDTRRTFESPTSPLGAPAYTTVHDTSTSCHAARPPYVISAAATQLPSPMNQSNFAPSYFNNTSPTFLQNSRADQTQYSNFSPMFNSTMYPQNGYQPNQSFAPSSFMQNNMTQFSPLQTGNTSQFTNSFSPNTFLQPNQTFLQPNQTFIQPNQTFVPIENQICSICVKDLMDQIYLNSSQSPQPTPVSYNFFLVHQSHSNPNETVDEPMLTNDPDDLGSCHCLCLQDGACSQGTSTTDLRWGKDDPCATSTPASWSLDDKQPSFVTTEAEKQKPNTVDDKCKDSKNETEKEADSKTQEAEELTTQEIISAILDDIMPPTDDGNDKEASKNNGAKSNVDKKSCPRHCTTDKEASTSGCCKSKENPAGHTTGHTQSRPACGCAKQTKKVSFAEIVTGAGADVTRTMDFLQFEAEMDSLFVELEETERVFINQAEEIIRIDNDHFKSREQLISLGQSLVAEVNMIEQIDRELELMNSQREQMEAFAAQLESYYDAYDKTAPPTIRKYVYGLYESVNCQIFETNVNLSELGDLIREQHGSITQQEDPVCQIMNILGHHIDTLNNIERKVDGISRETDEVSTLFHQFSWGHSS